MNEEINSDKNKNYFEKINPKDTNEIKKKNFEMNYKQYIEKNKTLISDNFLVSSIKTKKCIKIYFLIINHFNKNIKLMSIFYLIHF